MKGLMMGAKTNQMNPTIDEVGDKGKCLEPMRYMVSSTTHMHASVIKVMGKIRAFGPLFVNRERL